MSYTFDATTGNASVTGYSDSSTITKQIAEDAGTRTIIGVSGLNSKTFSLTSLVLPTTLITISDYTYQYSVGIAGPVNFSSLANLVSIGYAAFYNNNKLTGSVNLSGSTNLTTIGGAAFAGCQGFTGTINLPSSLTSLGTYAFQNAHNFTGALNLSNLTILTIGEHTFQNLYYLTSLTLPSTLTSIGQYAFENCSGFTGQLNLSTSTNLLSIGNNAFVNCTGFTSLTLPSTLTSIGQYAFYNCNKLDGILNLPSSVTSIGQQAFYGCAGLDGFLDLSNLTGLTVLNYGTFIRCTGLTSIALPTSLTSIGGYNFYRSVNIAGELDLSNANSLTTIGQGAFEDCKFTKIALPINLTTIGGWAFISNPSLVSVYFKRGCTLKNTTFNNVPNVTVYSYNDTFTIVTDASGTTPASSTIGTFSPTYNPLSNFFSKWRLYDYPYPKQTSYYQQGVSSFTLQYNQFVFPKFYTYSPVSKTNYVVKIDGVTYTFIQTYNSTTKRTFFLGVTFIPSGSQELTIDDNGPMYLNEGLTVTQNNVEVQEVDVNNAFSLFPIAASYLAIFDGKATDLPTQQFNQCPFTIYENNVKIEGGAFFSEDLTLSPYFKESRMFARSIIYTLEPDVPVMVQLVDANTGNPMTEPVESTGSYYIGNLPDGSYYLRIVNESLTYDHTIIADVCFVKGTIVKTDQGLIEIDKITNQTLNHKPITVTKTIHHDPYLVKVSAGAFGELPTRDTYMSLKHHIMMGVPVMAKNLINGDTITEVPYDGEPLYNVLVDTHTTMRVHGMLVETLDPNSIVGLFYRAKLSPKQKNKMIRMINEEPERAKRMLMLS